MRTRPAFRASRDALLTAARSMKPGRGYLARDDRTIVAWDSVRRLGFTVTAVVRIPEDDVLAAVTDDAGDIIAAAFVILPLRARVAEVVLPARWDGARITVVPFTRAGRRRTRSAYRTGLACAEESEIRDLIRLIGTAEPVPS